MDGSATTRSAGEARLLDAVGAAVIATDLTGRIFHWNLAAEQLYGYSAAEMLGASVMDLFVRQEDLQAAGAIMTQVLAGRTWSGEFPVRRKDGSTTLVRITDGPIVEGDTVVGVVGLSEEITDRRVLETQAADRDMRLRLALDAAGLGTWRWDAATGRSTWDERLEALFGLPPGGFDGTDTTWESLVHPEDRAEMLAAVDRALRGGTAYAVRYRVIRPDGTTRWLEGRGQVTLGPDGELTGTVGCAYDATARVEAEQRLVGLQQAITAIGGEQTVPAVAETVVRESRRLFGATDVSLLLRSTPRAALSVVAGAPTVGGAAADAVTDAVTTGGLVLVPPTDDQGGAACLPLRSSADLVGLLVLHFDGHADLAPETLAALGTLAGQAAVALERARLLTASQRTARELQAGLAPQPLPAVPGLELAARLTAGGDVTELVGGDWYDAIELDDGRLALVIGDVMGRGVRAAATMTRIRAAVRAYVAVDPDPAVVLRKLDRLVAREDVDEFVTLAYAVVDAAAGTVELASAGHLPMIVVDPHGQVRLVDVGGSPPVGLTTETRETVRTACTAGTTVLLLTDGLVERPDSDLDVGLQRAADQLCGLLRSGATGADAVAALTAAAPPGGDDVTLLLARLR